MFLNLVVDLNLDSINTTISLGGTLWNFTIKQQAKNIFEPDNCWPYLAFIAMFAPFKASDRIHNLE